MSKVTLCELCQASDGCDGSDCVYDMPKKVSVLDRWVTYGSLSLGEKAFVKNIVGYPKVKGYSYDMAKLEVLMEDGVYDLTTMKIVEDTVDNLPF